MWISDYCKLCLIQSRCKDLLTLGRADLLPKLLKYLGVILDSTGRSEAFANSYTYIKELLNSQDPYSEVKKELSRKASKVAEEVRNYLLMHDWDLIKALEFSAAANIIDTSVLGFESLELGEAIWDKPKLNDFRGIPNDKVVIALDNSGEFEVDLILAEALLNNGYEVELAVRSDSYEIDVTYGEVLERVRNLSLNVTPTPSNMPPSMYVRDGFLISKGIANAEAYVEFSLDINSLHLFRAKCSLLPEVLSVPKNSSVIIDGRTLASLTSKFRCI